MRTDDLGRTWTVPPRFRNWRGESGPTTSRSPSPTSRPAGMPRAVKLLVDRRQDSVHRGGRLRLAGENAPVLRNLRMRPMIRRRIAGPAGENWRCRRRMESSFALAAAVPNGWSSPTARCWFPSSFSRSSGGDYQVTVLHCSFDGTEMKYLRAWHRVVDRAAAGDSPNRRWPTFRESTT